VNGEIHTIKQVAIAIHGAAGRMGRRLVALGHADPELKVVAAVEAANHPEIGSDAGLLAGVGPLGVPLTAGLPERVGAVIDFSVPAATVAIARQCAAHNVPLVAATTGLSEDQQRQLDDLTSSIPILWAPNMSLAVNLVMRLSRMVARALADHRSGVDVEILERHHRYKVDAPSGTALAFGQIIAEEMGQRTSRHGRQGQVGVRPNDEIGYHAVRAGDHPGEHTILFGLLGETIELRVSATSRDAYAHGALAAAKFIANQPAGRYSMADVLGLRTEA